MKKFLVTMVVLLATFGFVTGASAQGYCNVCDYSWGMWFCVNTSPSGDAECFATSISCGTWGRCGGGTCFTEGVLVSTPSGDVAIQDLAVGDKVLSWQKDGPNVPSTITEVHKHQGSGYIVINGTISTTAEHPYYINDKWVDAGELKIGDKFVDINGDPVVVSSIDIVNKGVRVYNISVDGTSTYFANGILVHNKGPVPRD